MAEQRLVEFFTIPGKMKLGLTEDRRKGGQNLLLGTHKLLFIVVIAFSLTSSCLTTPLQSGIEKISPNGLYRVKITFTRGDRSRDHIDKAKFQFFQDQEVIDTWEWQQEDQYELTFSELMPVIEWVDNNVLRLGAERPNFGFSDELIVLNASNETLKFMGISYGRYESFKIFDLAPGSQIAIRATPRFHPEGAFNSSLGYGGTTRGGKRFGNVMEGKAGESPADGPLKFIITITAKDLQQY